MSLGLGLNLGLGRGGGNPARRIVRPFFNGIPTSGMTFTGGPNATLDNSGVLQKPALDVPAITGGRFVNAATGFVDTTAEGADLYANTLVRGIKLYTDADPLEFKRYLSEPAVTSHGLYNRDLTNAAWVKSNTTAAKDQTGVGGVANSASSLTASASSGTCLQSITLASGARTFCPYVKRITGTGTVEITLSGGTSWTDITSSLNTGAWYRGQVSATITNPQVGFRLGTSGDKIAVDYAGCQGSAFATSPIETTSAAVVRQATRLVCPSAGVLRGNDIAIMGQVIPSAGGQSFLVLFSSRTDVSNILSVYTPTGGKVTLRKQIDGTNYFADAIYTPTASIPFRYQAYQSITYGMGISVSYWTGSAWSAWTTWATNADTQDAIVAPTYEVGSSDGGGHFAGNYQLFRTFFTSDPKAYLEALR